MPPMTPMNPMNPYLMQYLQSLQNLAAQAGGMVQQANQAPQVNQGNQVPQALTPAMMHVDIIPVDSFDEVDNWSVGNGQTMVFALRDESCIYFKSGTKNGSIIEYYDHRKQDPDPKTDYVTKEYLRDIITALTEKWNEQKGAADGTV